MGRRLTTEEALRGGEIWNPEYDGRPPDRIEQRIRELAAQRELLDKAMDAMRPLLEEVE